MTVTIDKKTDEYVVQYLERGRWADYTEESYDYLGEAIVEGSQVYGGYLTHLNTRPTRVVHRVTKVYQTETVEWDRNVPDDCKS